MKKTIILFISLLLSACSSSDVQETNRKYVSLNTVNILFKEDINNQITGLQEMSIALQMMLTENKNTNLDKILTISKQLRSFSYYQTLEITDGKTTEGRFIPLAESMEHTFLIGRNVQTTLDNNIFNSSKESDNVKTLISKLNNVCNILNKITQENFDLEKEYDLHSLNQTLKEIDLLLSKMSS